MMRSMFMLALALVIGIGDAFNPAMRSESEVAVMLDDSNSVTMANFERMINFTRALTDYFVVGENDTRMSVVLFSSRPRIVFNLTGDIDVLKSLEPKRDGGGTIVSRALREVNENVFAAARFQVVKMVVLVTDGKPQDYKLARRIVDEMKREGVIFFVGCTTQGGGPCDNDHAVEAYLQSLATNNDTFFYLDEFDTADEGEVIIEAPSKEMACRYDRVCRYADAEQERCVADLYQPDVDDPDACNTTKPIPSRRECNKTECEKLCELWPWADRPCEWKHLNTSIDLVRDPRKKPARVDSNNYIFDNCTQLSTKFCEEVELDTTTEEPTTTNATEKATTTVVMAKEQEPVDEGFPVWAIGTVSGVGGGLILLAVIVIVIVALRRRKKKLNAKLNLATATPSTRSTRLGLQAGGEGAEHAMEVSLQEKTDRKPSSTSLKLGSKSKQQSSKSVRLNEKKSSVVSSVREAGKKKAVVAKPSESEKSSIMAKSSEKERPKKSIVAAKSSGKALQKKEMAKKISKK